MNESGKAVSRAVRTFSIPPIDVLVVHDDLQRELGKVSRKLGGSANGHNGLTSISECLGTYKYRRLRVGIGRPHSRDPDAVAEYVLGKFTSFEKQQLSTHVWDLVEKEILSWCVEDVR